MIRKLNFDLNNRLEPLTLLLSHRNHKLYGAINTATDLVFQDNLQPSHELNFTVHKEILTENGLITCNVWDEIKDFRYVFVPELKEYFNIRVRTTDTDQVTKNITATNASVEELTNVRLYDIEINTEGDIAREDYKEPTVFYNPTNPSASLLNRIFEKARHYTVRHVDDTLWNLQRTFTISDTNLYDFCTGTLSAEMGCLFVFDSTIRGVFVYDLLSTCASCNYRGDFTDACPECGSTDILKGYGEDTSIFISTENLAQSIELSANQGQTKNCFKVEGGDELITATVANCNPNGSGYIYRFSPEMEEDMSPELVAKLAAYNRLYESLHPEYTELMAGIYDSIDEELYLTSGMMPSPTVDPDTTAQKQLMQLTAKNLSPVAVTDVSRLSLATANSAVLSMAKVLCAPAYKVEIASSSLTSQTWKGKFRVTSYHDETDTAISANNIVITINDDYETFIRQRVDKMFHKEEAPDLSNLLTIEDYSTFVAELSKYCLNRLISFEAAFQSCMDILIEQGVGDADTYPELYTGLYLPYYNKLAAIQAEMTVRSDQVEKVHGQYETLSKQKEAIQSRLNLEHFLGEELLLEFLAHRMEDVYRNDNYISDGLDNARLFETAQELINQANQELHRSSSKVYTISTTLENLLKLQEFRPLLDKFSCGNWLRIQIDQEIYRLRLLSYRISFDDRGGTVLDVEFSDISRANSMAADMNSILSKASSMAQSYSYVSRQAAQGADAKISMDTLHAKGLNASNTAIVNADSQEVVFGENGILLRAWDDTLGDYSPEQVKILHNSLCFTTDGWKTSSTALGKVLLDGVSTYGLIAKYVGAGKIWGSEIVGGVISGTKINNGNGTFQVDENGHLIASSVTIDGVLNASADSRIAGFQSTSKAIYYVKDSLGANKNGVYLGTDGIALGAGNAFTVNRTGAVTASNVNITGGSLTIDSKFHVDPDGTVTAANMNITGGSLHIGENFSVTSNGTLKAANANISGTITGSSYTASGTVTKYASDYSKADLARIKELIMGIQTLTLDDLEKYDINGDARITLEDYMLIKRLVEGYEDARSFDISINISPASTNRILTTDNVYLGRDGIYAKSLVGQTVQSDAYYALNEAANAYVQGASGSFTTGDGKRITVSNGIITGIQ